MRRVLLAAFGSAKLDSRSEVRPDDVVEDRAAKKARIGSSASRVRDGSAIARARSVI